MASSPPNVVRHCSEISPYYSETITDKFAYFAGQDSKTDAFLNRWPFCKYESVVQLPLISAGAIHALNDESFVLVDHNGVQVISGDGRRKFLWSVVKDDVPLNKVAASENGDRHRI
jgi:hypothetical protein